MEIFKNRKIKAGIVAFVCIYSFIFLIVLYTFSFKTMSMVNTNYRNSHIQMLEANVKNAVRLLDLEISRLDNNHSYSKIFAYISINYLTTLDNVFSKAEGHFYILDMKDSIIFPEKSVLKGASIIKRNIMGSDKPFGYFSIFDSEDKLYVFYHISSEYNYCIFNVLHYSQVEIDTYPASKRILLFTAITIVIVTAIFLLFKRHVYNPIITIEKVLSGILRGGVDLRVDIDKTNELYPTANILNNLIDRIKNLINLEYKAKILKKQAELNALQSQINPHFLYNTLDSIRGLAVNEGALSVSHMTKALSSLFRYSISLKDNMVTLKDELKNIDNYLIIQKYRFRNKFEVIKEIDDPDGEILKCMIPKLTIQPIIENAIYHGLENKLGKGIIKISAIATEKRLIISIQDDGIGMDVHTLRILNARLSNDVEAIISESNVDQFGIALTNVNERIKLSFGNEYGLTAYSTQGIGTTIEILLPLVKMAQQNTFKQK